MKRTPLIPRPEEFLSEIRAGLPESVRTAGKDWVEALWNEAARVAGLVKWHSTAATAAKALCGIYLRALREYYFGPRNSSGGRPKKPENVSGFSWADLLTGRLGIEERTARNWMQLADAVESIAEAEGLDLRATCEKLPWDWTPEEAAKVDATVRKLCEDKTQRQLLQADFLTALGYVEPQKPNSSNNPLGKNGGKKKPAKSAAVLLEERREAARILIYGTPKPGRVELGSHARFFLDAINNQGADIEALPKVELQNFYDHEVKPFADLIRKLLKDADR